MQCRTICEYLPGFLIPADLERLIPSNVKSATGYDGNLNEIFAWAENALLASPGALVADSNTGQIYRIPTLVLAAREDGSCIFLSADKRCMIWENSPFGCSMFTVCTKRSKKKDDELVMQGMKAILEDIKNDGPYCKIWEHLNEKGFHSPAPEEKRRAMRLALGGDM